MAVALPDTRPRALIADGDLSTRLLLSHHLEIEGFKVDLWTDRRTTLDRLKESPFALVVLDAALPGLDGIALSARSELERSIPAPRFLSSPLRPTNQTR
jgi:DNA-binding response OmpR family regulator